MRPLGETLFTLMGGEAHFSPSQSNASHRILSLKPFFFGKKEKNSVSHDCSVVENILLGAEECRPGFRGQAPMVGDGVNWASCLGGKTVPEQVVWMASIKKHVCARACVCACMCVCARTHVCMYACMYVCAYMCACTHVYVCLHICAHTHVCMCACTYVCACMYVCTHACMCVHVCMHICVCMHVCTCMCACESAHMYVCTCVCMCIYVCLHVCMCVCMCAHMRVCMCVHMCIYTYMCVCVLAGELDPILAKCALSSRLLSWEEGSPVPRKGCGDLPSTQALSLGGGFMGFMEKVLRQREMGPCLFVHSTQVTASLTWFR